MQAVYIAVILSTLIYFIFIKTKIDYFSLAFFSSAIYFIPGIFGYTGYIVSGIQYRNLINEKTYLIMIVVLLSIFVFSIFYDLVKNEDEREIYIIGQENVVKVFFLLATLGLLVMFLTTGKELFNPSKSVLSENLNRFHILFYISSLVGLPVAYYNNKKKYTLLFLLYLLFNVYIGFRSPFVIGIISVLVVSLSKEKTSLYKTITFKKLVLISLFGLFVFSYKLIYKLIKQGKYNEALQLVIDPKFYIKAITHSEPFVTQHVLNTITEKNFNAGAEFLYSLIYQVIPFSNHLVDEHPSFSSYFKQENFSFLNYGLASNIWGEMWSIGGWLLLFSFLLIFNLVLVLGNNTLRYKGILKYVLAPMFSYWAFFIHRSTFGYTVNLEKRVIYVLLSAWFVSYALFILKRSIVHKRTTHKNPIQP